MNLIQCLVEHLRSARSDIVRKVDVVVEIYDPTYGLRACTDTIEYVDFDALCDEMDKFAETFS